MRVVWLPGAFLLVLLSAGCGESRDKGLRSAPPTAPDSARIIPWRQIGNVRLGMTHVRANEEYGLRRPIRRKVFDGETYQGHGTIKVSFARGHVTTIATTSPAYSTRSGIHVGMLAPHGPCHRVGGKCVFRWRTFQSSTTLNYFSRFHQAFTWEKHFRLGRRFRGNVILFVYRRRVVGITMSRALICKHGLSNVADACVHVHLL